MKAIELTTYRLDGLAEQGFKTLQMERLAVLPPLTCGEFSKAFMARFLTASRMANLDVDYE